MTAVNTNINLGDDSNELLTSDVVGFISGSGGSDTIQGAINGVAPGSTLDGGAGNDSLFSRGIGDIALGGAGNDTIRNSSGQASLYGGGGSDVIVGEDRQTTVYGGGGNDSLLFEDSQNLAYGEDGNDSIIGLDGGDIFSGGAGNDYLKASVAGDASILFGNEGADTLLLGNTSADSAFGGKDSDYVFAGSSASAAGQFLFGNFGADTVEYLGKGKGVVLDGDRAIDGVGGYFPANGTDAGADMFVLTSSGTDLATDITIAGGGGNDSLVGQVVGTAGGAAAGLLGAGAAVYMGKGDDFFNLVSGGSSLISADLGNDSGSISLRGNDTLYGDGAAQGSDATLGNDKFTISGSGGNVIFGDTGTANGGTDGGNDSIMLTGGGSNIVYGGGGNDSLTSNGGGNTLIGGAGNDIYSFGAGDVIPFDSLGINTYLAGSGVSSSSRVTVQAGDSFVGGATFVVVGEAELIKTLDNGGVVASDEKDLIQIKNVDGVTSLKGGDDTFSGVDLAVSGAVDGGSGNDLIAFTGTSIAAGKIVGGVGNDSIGFGSSATVFANIDGGAGNDSINVPGIFAGSIVGGDGVDTINIGTLAAGASIDAGAGDEKISIAELGTVAGVASIFGGEGNDTITVGANSTGTNVDLVIDGGAGNDIIYGKQKGGDSISGGAGDDTLFGGGFGLALGSSSTGSNVSEALGDTLIGGAGADVFVLGTSAKLGYLMGSASVGTQSFGQEGFFFTGSAATAAGSGIFNGVFGADVIVDFDPNVDKIVFNTGGFVGLLNVAGSIGSAQFTSGPIDYLTNDLVTTGLYIGSTVGTTAPSGLGNTFGLVGDAKSAGTFSFTSSFGSGFTSTVAVGAGSTPVRVLSNDLPVGGTAFSTSSTTDLGTSLVAGFAGTFFQFSSGTGNQIDSTGGILDYDTNNGALYYEGKLLAIFSGAPTLTSTNFFGAAFGVNSVQAPLVL